MMNKLLVALALGASVTPVAAIAQAPQAAPGSAGRARRMDAARRYAATDATNGRQHVSTVRPQSRWLRDAGGGGAGHRPDGGGARRRCPRRTDGNIIVRCRECVVADTGAVRGAGPGRFDAQDLNHDGIVTTAERQQARAQRGQQARRAARAVAIPAPATGSFARRAAADIRRAAGAQVVFSFAGVLVTDA